MRQAPERLRRRTCNPRGLDINFGDRCRSLSKASTDRQQTGHKAELSMRMNGWYRLWILISFITLIAGALYISASWPNGKSIADSLSIYEQLDPSARAQIEENESNSNIGVQMPNGHIIYLKNDVTASRKTEVLRQYEAAVERNLHSKREDLIIQTMLACLFVSASILISGLLVAWVIRGFRQDLRKPSD